MNILYLNHYAGSPALGMEYRPYYLSREWVRMGHSVHMVAASYSHVRARQPQWRDQPLVKKREEDIDGIRYHWYPTPPYEGNGTARVRNIASFLRQVWFDTRRLVREIQPQIVIASSTYPMDIWVARHIARKAGARLVFEVHDLWPLSPIEIGGMSPKHPFIQLCQLSEDTAYQAADVVISMLPKVHAYMASRGLNLKKLHIVPNGITLDEWEGPSTSLRPDVADAILGAQERHAVVVGYAGSMGRPNALDALLDAAACLQSQPGPKRIEIVMVGDGHEREQLAARLRRDKLELVHLLPPIPKAQIPSFLSLIDIAYIGWQRVPIYRFGIAPNKLMDYMMAGVPVLHAVEAGNDPVREANCGITVPPNDIDAIVHGLHALAEGSQRQRREMGERGRTFVRAHHTYPVLARRFLEACGVAPKDAGSDASSARPAAHNARSKLT